MAKYHVEIRMVTRGKRSPETTSSYDAYRVDGQLIKSCVAISNDPEGFWARVDAFGAILNDAQAIGIVVKEEEVDWRVSRSRVDGRGKPY